MPRAAPLQTNFTGGEISPRLIGRQDLDRYGSAAQLLQNFVPLPAGPARRRPGSRHVTNGRVATEFGLMKPFRHPDTNYMLELGVGSMRVYRQNALVMAPPHTFGAANVDILTDEFIFDPATRGAILEETHDYDNDQGNLVFTDVGGLPAGVVISTNYFVLLAPTLVFAFADVTIADPGVITVTGHGLMDDGSGFPSARRMGPFRLVMRPEVALGTTISAFLPTFIVGGGGAGLVKTNRDWFIDAIDADTFHLYVARAGGVAVEITSQGSPLGTFRFIPTQEYLRQRFRVSLTAGGAARNLTTTGGAANVMTPDFPLQIRTPYTLAAISDESAPQIAQSTDDLYFSHRSQKVQKLSRIPLGGTGSVSHSSWSFDDFEFLDGPYLPVQRGQKVLETTLTPALLTAGVETNILASNPMFTVHDLGRLLRLDNDVLPDTEVDWGWGVIVEVIDESNVTVFVQAAFAQSGASTQKWHLSVWGPEHDLTTLRRGWPRAIHFVEQRMALGGALVEPDTFYTSATVFFDVYSPTTLLRSPDAPAGVPLFVDSQALVFKILGKGGNQIQWIQELQVAVVGTTDGVFSIQASSGLNVPLTPLTITAQQQTSRGTGTVEPIRIEDSILYATRSRRALRLLRFEFESDSYRSDEISVFSEHLTDARIRSMAYAEDPDSIVWTVNDDGTHHLVSLLREQQIVSWASQRLGGVNELLPASVDSLAVLPSVSGDYDQIWFSVHRDLGANEFRHIEYLTHHTLLDPATLPDGKPDKPNSPLITSEWILAQASTSTFYLDSAIYQEGVASNVIGNLSHLEGQTVLAIFLRNGTTESIGISAPLVVTGAQITLPVADVVADVVVGLPYLSDLRTLPSPIGGPEGPIRGKLHRIDSATVLVDRTIGGQIGDASTRLKNLPQPQSLLDGRPIMFGGLYEIDTIDSDWSRDATLLIRQEQPYPMTIVGIAQHLRSSGR